MAEDVSGLLSSMASQEALPHSHDAQRERRQRVTAAMNQRLRALDSAPRRSLRRLWPLLPLVAVAALAIGSLVRSPDPARLEVTAEGLSARPAPPPPPADSPAPAPAIIPSEAPSGSPVAPLAPKPKAPVALPSTSAPIAAESEPPGLATQNELFQQAARAARQGDDVQALEHLQKLLDQHPDSVLAPDASVRKFRTLARLGRTAEARAAARHYLDHHPNGFAAAEARALANTEP